MGDWYTIGLALGTLLVTSFTCMGLLALWAATSPRHWFVRSAAVLVVLSPLLLIPAYEPWIVFALQACVVVAGTRAWRWTARRQGEAGSSENAATPNRRFRFSLGTLLAITTLVAMLTAIVTRMVTNWPPQNFESWTTIVLNGVCGGCAVLLGAWVFASKRKRIVWPAALALCLGLGAVMAQFDWLVVAVKTRQGWPPDTGIVKMMILLRLPSRAHLALVWLAVIPAVTAGTWLTVYVRLAGMGVAAMIDEPTGSMPQRRAARQIVARCIFGLLLVTLAIPPALVVWKLLHVPPIPNIVVPQPNGFDDIMAAGKTFRYNSILGTLIEPGPTEELAAEIAAHAGAYEQLRLGLRRDIQAPVWTGSGDQITACKLLLDDIAAAYSAARGLMWEAKLAQQQNRFGDAATIAIENMQLGQAVTRGGVSADYGIGLIIEGLGDRSLYRILPQLDADQCREMTAALVEIEHGRESLDAARRRGRAWCALAAGWFVRFRMLLEDVVPSYDWRGSVRVGLARKEAVTRLLILELALRAFQLERGALPDRLEQLTPEFLAKLPVDPFDPEGRPLHYRPTDDGYVVYSVGPDGKDDGGRPPSPDENSLVNPDGDGDLRLDIVFPPDDAEEDDMEG